MQKRSRPLEVKLPDSGIGAFESVHDPAFRMERRADPFDKLVFVGRGTIEITERDAISRRAPALSLVYIPKDTPHRIEDVEASTLFLLCIARPFGTARWDRVAESLGAHVRVWHRLPFDQTLLPLWRRLLAEQDRDDDESDVVVQAETLRLLVALARTRTDPTEDLPERIERLVEEVRCTSFEPWTVDTAAHWVGVSRRQFTMKFKFCTGETFITCLTRFRLDRAKALLRSGGYTVAGAAYASGFGDLAHFYRVFRKYEGVTPLEAVAPRL